MNEPTRITREELDNFAKGSAGSAQRRFRFYFWCWRSASLGKNPRVNYSFEEAATRATLDVRRDFGDDGFLPRLVA